jgi:hypothetical protein
MINWKALLWFENDFSVHIDVIDKAGDVASHSFENRIL